MARNTLVINCDLRETRVALIENGVIAELHIERATARGTVGNVVLGRVTRVLPGMQAAFIDVGMERAAFLHVEDLIRPDDFDAYLAGATRDEHDPSGRGEGGRRQHTHSSPSASDGKAESDAGDEDEAPSDPEPIVASEEQPQNGQPDEAVSVDATVEADEPSGEEDADEAEDEDDAESDDEPEGDESDEEDTLP